MPPLILNIESATDICSVCLSLGKELLAIKTSEKQFVHSEVITRLIEGCFKQAGQSMKQLDAVAVSNGPGSYTSLRVGASTAKGICYALDKPMIAVDTLQSIALATVRQEKRDALYAPMIDARRMEVYTALYDREMNRIEDTKAMIIDDDSFSAYFQKGFNIVLSGNGAPKTNNALSDKAVVLSEVICSAAHLIPLAYQAFKEEDFSNIAYFSPLYYKPPNITIPKKTL